jgi:hypothetical protein
LPGVVLYSTNPWIAHDIAMRFLGGKHYVWCSEYYDPRVAGAASSAAAIAPSSCPKSIYDALHADFVGEDTHSSLVKGYRKTFKRLARECLASGTLTKPQHDEIVATVNSNSFRIWRPVLYIIPKLPIKQAGRLIAVPHDRRAAYGPEWQISDLMPTEFDVIER